MGLTDTEKWRKKIDKKIRQAHKAVQSLKKSVSATTLPPVRGGSVEKVTAGDKGTGRGR